MTQLPPLREVVKKHGLTAAKSLGQNFIFDPNLLARIAAIPGDLTGRSVLEIGPGPGGLTRALLAAGANVTAIERDRRCIPALSELAEAYPEHLQIIEDDALNNGAKNLFATPPNIVSNLPFNIGTALLVQWLSCSWPPWWRSCTLMFQKEVADRIVAKPGTQAYGRLSVLAQWRSSARTAMVVNRSAFTPPPKVTSAVVHLVPKSSPDSVRLETLELITQSAFGQRRKMLRQSLKNVPGANSALELVGIESSRRAETVSVEDYVALARAINV